MILDKNFIQFIKVGSVNFVVGHIFVVLFSLTDLSNFLVVLFSHLCGLTFNFFSYKHVFSRSIVSDVKSKTLFSYILFNIVYILVFTYLLSILNPITGDRIISVLIICGPLNLISYFFYKFIYSS